MSIVLQENLQLLLPRGSKAMLGRTHGVLLCTSHPGASCSCCNPPVRSHGNGAAVAPATPSDAPDRFTGFNLQLLLQEINADLSFFLPGATKWTRKRRKSWSPALRRVSAAKGTRDEGRVAAAWTIV